MDEHKTNIVLYAHKESGSVLRAFIDAEKRKAVILATSIISACEKDGLRFNHNDGRIDMFRYMRAQHDKAQQNQNTETVKESVNNQQEEQQAASWLETEFATIRLTHKTSDGDYTEMEISDNLKTVMSTSTLLLKFMQKELP